MSHPLFVPVDKFGSLSISTTPVTVDQPIRNHACLYDFQAWYDDLFHHTYNVIKMIIACSSNLDYMSKKGCVQTLGENIDRQ